MIFLKIKQIKIPLITGFLKMLNNIRTMDLIKPKLYVFNFSETNVVERQNVDENAYISFTHKAYIFACSTKEAFLIYMNYCNILKINLDFYISLSEFEKHLSVVRKNIKHFTIPRIERLYITCVCYDSIDTSSYIVKYNYKSSKEIIKHLYNSQPLEEFDDIDNNFCMSNLYINSTYKKSDLIYDNHFENFVNVF